MDHKPMCLAKYATRKLPAASGWLPCLRNLLAVFIFSLVFTACGSDGDNKVSGALADVQGRWVSTTCVPDEDQSIQEEITVSAATAMRTEVRYINSTVCEGDVTINTNISSTITATGDTTTVTTGEAKNIDIRFNRAYITASEAALTALESQGTTLQDLFTAEGIPDINNIVLSEVVDGEQLFTIYQVAGSTLFVGEDSILNDGTSAQQRHSVLASDEYIKQ